MQHIGWIVSTQAVVCSTLLLLLLLTSPLPSASSSGSSSSVPGPESPRVSIQFRAPSGVPVKSFTGALYWNTGRVVVQPPIRAVIEDGPSYLRLICGFQLHQRAGPSGSPPVEIRMRDPARGTGRLFVKDGANLTVYKAASSDTAPAYFDFDISAFDCDSPMHVSPRVPVLLRVEEFERPVFAKPGGYTARVAQTAKPGVEVLRVGAAEPHKSANVCRYEIEHATAADAGSAADLPFDIDGAGSIRVKSPFVPTSREQHYALRVTASDCSVPESRKASVPVSIVAYPTEKTLEAAAEEECSVRWLGVPEKLLYTASSGVRTFAGDARLSECKLARRGRCVQSSAVVKVTVESSSWADDTCDRSAHSLYDQRRVCQVKPASVDLLNPHYKPPEEEASTESLAPASAAAAAGGCQCCRTKNKKKSPERKPPQPPQLHQHVSSFDGVSYYMDVPADALPASHRLGDQFTLHFWLQHEAPTSHGGDHPSSGGAKEQLLCSADESGRNRHHYSVFLHNCKLVLLLRREYQPGESADKLRPAEWRFRLAEVCDGMWHHYAVSYSSGRVKLHVDGKIFAHSAANPQVLEDYPMHRTPDSRTRLTVGACWHSSDATYRQFLKGALAGLVMLRGELESDSAVHCLNQCHERLDFRAMTQLEPGMSVSLNADFTMIEIKGHNDSEVARLLRQIGYTNVHRRPAKDAKRAIRLDTSVACTDPKVKVAVDPAVIDVHVTEPHPSAASGSSGSAAATRTAQHLCISGPNLVRYAPEELASPGGVAFLSGLDIDLTDGSNGLLDACLLRTSPDFSVVESLAWPAGAAADAGIEGRASQRDLVLDGPAAASVYQRLLSAVAYSNRNPIIRYRTFVLTCSVKGGSVVSNEFAVKLSVLHPAVEKHTVKKQLPDSGLVIEEEKEKASASHHHSDETVGTDGRHPMMSSVGREQQQQQHHFAESHAAAAIRRPDAHAAVAAAGSTNGHYAVDAASSSGGAPVAPIIVGVSTAGLLVLVLGLMYLRYRRSFGSSSSSSGSAAGGSCRGSGGHGKTLPVDAESQAEMEWDNSALNITVNPLDNEENMSDSGSEEPAGHDDYVEDELDLDGSSSCPEDDEDLDGMMTASGLLMQRSAQIASSEDELDDDNNSVVCQMVTGPDAVRYGQQKQQMQQKKQQQLEWDDSSLPAVM